MKIPFIQSGWVKEEFSMEIFKLSIYMVKRIWPGKEAHTGHSERMEKCVQKALRFKKIFGRTTWT